MPLSLCCCAVISGQIFSKVVAASESRGVKYSATNHERNAGHFMDKFIFSKRIGKNLFVLEVLFEGEAGSHHGGELDVVHDIGGVGGNVFFQDLFACPADAGNQASQGRGVHDRFHKLVVRHGYILELFF